MELIGFFLFLLISHLGVMQIFRLTTYHRYFWPALPLLLTYSVGIAWALYALEMHAFFLWQICLASVWLFLVGRKQSKIADAMLHRDGDNADVVRAVATSTTKTTVYYIASSTLYILVFAVAYVWLYNT